MRGINADMGVTALTRKVGRESENFFDDDFWAEQVRGSRGSAIFLGAFSIPTSKVEEGLI